MENTAEMVTTKQPEIKGGELTVSQEIRNLTKIIELETRKRKLMTKYVRDNLIDGVDYGSIEGETKSGKKFQSKKGLFKPGAEKLCSLFHLTPRFEKDNDAWVMFGNKQGVVCFICRLYNQAGAEVGEGRGVATMTEASATENKTVKIAQKRAQVDAVIRFAALSDVFSQDLETVAGDELANETGNVSPKNQPKVYMATEGQMTKIAVLLGKKKKDKEKIYSHYNINTMKDLTFKQADTVINKLDRYPDFVEPKQEVKVEDVIEGPPSRESKSGLAANYLIQWVRLNFDKLKKIGAIDSEADISRVDYLTQDEYVVIKSKFDGYMKSYKALSKVESLIPVL